MSKEPLVYKKLTDALQEHIDAELTGQNRLKYLFDLSEEALVLLKKLEIKRISFRKYDRNTSNEVGKVAYRVTFKKPAYVYFSSYMKNEFPPFEKKLTKSSFTHSHYTNKTHYFSKEEETLIAELLQPFDLESLKDSYPSLFIRL